MNEAAIALRGYDGRPVDERAAMALLAESADLDPDYPDAPERMGSLLLQQAQGRMAQVGRLLTQGDHGRAQGEAQAILQQLDAAIAAHRRALAAYPRSLNSLSNLGAANLLRGEVFAEMARAAATAGDGTSTDRLRAAAGAEYAAAIGWFDRALVLAPDNRPARENRAYAVQRQEAVVGPAQP